LSMCQLHISLTRAAQIYLELHFCVELHTKKALRRGQRARGSSGSTSLARLTKVHGGRPGASVHLPLSDLHVKTAN